MKAEAQRVAIAEACGWKWFKWGESPGETNRFLALPRTDNGSFLPCPRPSHGGPVNISDLPDYPTDLNAIAEAERTLLKGICAEQHYATMLYRVMNEPARYCEIVYRATAAQRTEALVRFLGLWEDAP